MKLRSLTLYFSGPRLARVVTRDIRSCSHTDSQLFSVPFENTNPAIHGFRQISSLQLTICPDKMTKSILKNRLPKDPLPHGRPSSPSSTSPPPARSRSERNLDLALQHAHLIQQQKDVTNLIFTSTEVLLDYPHSTTTDPANPSAELALRATSLLQPFQPADYDALIEERNIDGKCGYVLCPHPHRVEETNARFRILRAGGQGKGGTGIKVVEKGELEKWCSKACGERALYLRVQLSEVPAWERAASRQSTLHILREATSTRMDGDNTGTEEEVRVIEEGLKRLAIERGQRQSNGIAPGVVDVVIRENDTMDDALEPPSQDALFESADGVGDIEGYTLRKDRHRAQRDSMQDNLDDKYDVMDTI